MNSTAVGTHVVSIQGSEDVQLEAVRVVNEVALLLREVPVEIG